MVRTVALLLTLVTGFTGLVYEVVWQRVLATLLGSHSEATAAVLGIFLGGLSLGYAVFGGVSLRLVRRAAHPGRALLLATGIVEGSIGLYAALFPALFAAVRAASLRLPGEPAGLAFGLDVAATALLLGPPTVAMGGTIPLLTQGLSRGLEDATRLHARVYATNTAGATAGALAAAFWLVPWLGLDGTLASMGAVNLLAGAGYAALAARAPALPGAAAAAPRPAARLPEGFAHYAAVALLAGFAMMTLQTAMNRIGALALGASGSTFAMVVATFVLCIALGSASVGSLRRIRPRDLALSQWALVLVLLLLYPGLENAPYWAHVLRLQFDGPAPSYLGFHAAVFAGLLAVALVPIGLSGALLPLLFHHLRRDVGDLGHTAGRLYSWNTIGSLLGALLGGYALLTWLDLDQTYRIAVLALTLAAAILTRRVGLAGRAATAAAVAVVAAALVLAPAWEPKRLASGLFRSKLPAATFADGADAFFSGPWAPWGAGDEVVYYHDDPTASIAAFRAADAGTGTAMAIVTNGKVDGNIPGDDLTTGLLALLPALFARRCESAFVIGYGTGMTVGELAALESVHDVTVAEISPGVAAAAPLFEGLNQHALASPKTHIVVSDAYRALQRSQARYDVIVSEPSNPWVTGVEMLYSREFLSAARARLAPGGVYAQWFHLYETDAATLALVLATYRGVFGEVGVWLGTGVDLVLLGFADDDASADLSQLEARAARPDFRSQLAALGISSLPRLLAHEVLPLGVLGQMELPDRVHTLFRPLLGDLAARAFFRGGNAHLPESVARRAAEVGARNSLVAQLRARRGGVLPDAERADLVRETCRVSETLCATLFAQWQHDAPGSEALRRELGAARGEPRLARELAPAVIDHLAALYGADAVAGRDAPYALARDLRRVFARYYHHAAPFASESLHAVWRRCAATDGRCRAQLDEVLGLGLPPTLVSRR